MIAYPIDNQIFADLVRMREGMIEKSRASAIKVAGIFVPWIGAEILRGSPGIYFVGIATAGPFGADQECTLKSRQQYSKDIISGKENGPGSSLFWRYVNCITKAVYGANYKECLDKIAWSNQFKIGVSPGNPTGVSAQEQEKTCAHILKREIECASLCPFIFLGSGHPSMIDKIFERKHWDDECFKKDRIWIMHPENRPPIFYMDHPVWLWRQGEEYFCKHAETVGGAVRERLGTLRH
jgi:hypothetical protein